MTALTMATAGQRFTLDQLVLRMTEPGFAALYGRRPSFAESSGHVSPTMLQLESPRSRYVRRWRRHAQRCPSCAAVFRYLGLPLR
jgi:hypothetical protein